MDVVYGCPLCGHVDTQCACTRKPFIGNDVEKIVIIAFNTVECNRTTQYAEWDLDRDPHSLISYGLKVEYKHSLKS